ncbi:hypothetical protein A3742_04130 [Oleiphilus sp. HI0071]|uniref:HDOD domain-containing protein n=2 Tax=Oleiphilus TaxID=141450 RepID=UPI0007C341E6|nr:MULTISPECIES: HDOD domain-containing protein [unclassified Oleiphilus]KZY74771.1 hypothetical protein A3737_00395 [Oleiphilus sp. HI0065]KZY87108.1 hypothetical protein A3742_04130 [Oleiphilus sp. HI0071]KZY91276.1 hypothetical protein A3744_05320 [Oleiphilus sp. HI0073]KZZ60253.1 hypothetical protein A3760_05105 [Oleiphilus sp. HI0122]KZZ65196.1 hypothetical protein A3765_06175 [Oleiphilus sp. HI0130]KZZ82105.1 hypothetical protein A3767_06325 [Oleiphilus sp. HI0133]
MSKKRGLHGWIRLLEGSQAAALSGLLKKLDSVTASDDSSAAQLSELILKDASLTSHIIRIGNSIQFNPSSTAVTTVSRAIINIGFKHIRSVCLAVKIMDSLLENGGSDLLFQRLAECLHAAHQTRGLCSKFNDTAREEAFIASLLSNLVELLVLSSGEDDVAELERKLRGVTTDKERNAVAEEVLGVRFDTLSKTLMKRWRIDGLVHQIYDPGATDSRLKAIELGESIVGATAKGPNSNAFKLALKESVKYTGKTGEQVRGVLTNSTYSAISALKEFGDERLINAVPEPGLSQSPKPAMDSFDASETDDRSNAASELAEDIEAARDKGDIEKPDSRSATESSVSSDHDPAAKSRSQSDALPVEGEMDECDGSALISPNPTIQLSALQKMSEMMLGDIQIKGFFKLLLGGLHKGVGLERSAFFLLDARRGCYSVKLASGSKTSDWPMSLIMKSGSGAGGLLDSLFKDDAPSCFKIKGAEGVLQHQKEIEALAYKTDSNAFILAPLSAKGKKIGLLYADMGVSHRSIDASHQAGFQQFFLQAKLALNVLAAR